jgi:hypothetical protein
LRANFGWHAAYFLGNFLFGTIEPPSPDCRSQFDTVVEAWRHHEQDDMIRAGSYAWIVETCGVVPLRSAMISNDPDALVNRPLWGEFVTIQTNSDCLTCAMRRLMAAKATVHTFGSRLGFWATAMSGRKGAFVNGQERVCVNVTNSQTGSIWHSWIPYAKNEWVYGINSRFYVCGPNVRDARLYINYLLW